MSDILEYDMYKFRVLNGDRLRLIKYCGEDKNVTIPDRIMFYTVAEIGCSAFRGNTKVVDITLPHTIEYIEEYSFSECIALEKINIPPLVTKIGKLTFEDCISLKCIDLEACFCDMDDTAFENAEPQFRNNRI